MRVTKENLKKLLWIAGVVLLWIACVVVFVIIVAPHIDWLANNFFSKIEVSRSAGLITLAVIAAVMGLMYGLVRRKDRHSIKTHKDVDGSVVVVATSPSTKATTATVTRIKSEWPAGRIVGWIVGGAAIALVVWVLSLGIAEVVKANRGQPRAAIAEPSNTRLATKDDSMLLPSLADLAPQAKTARPQRLTVYRDHEIEIPKVSNSSKKWDIELLNTTDEFMLRCVKNGVTTHDNRLRGVMDGGTILFPADADTYYIRCLNRDQATVVWTEK